MIATLELPSISETTLGLTFFVSSSVAHVCAGGHGSGSSLAVSCLRSGLNWREVTSRRSRGVPSSHGEWLAHRCPSAQLWLSPHEGHISVLHRSVHGVAPGTRRRGLSPPGRLGQVLQEAAILTLRAGVRGREILRTSFGRRMRGELTWCPLRVATREERLEAPLSAENTTDPSATGTIVPSLVSGPACVGG